MAALGIIGALVSAGGSILSGIMANQQARAQAEYSRKQGEAQAAALEVRAGEERAASQREAIRRAREARLVLSRQQAVAAASGGGAADPTVINLMAEVGREGDYRQSAAIYEGETRGRGLEYEGALAIMKGNADAAIARMQGRQALLSGFIGGFSSMINGLSNFSQFSFAPPSFGGSSGSYFYGAPSPFSAQIPSVQSFYGNLNYARPR